MADFTLALRLALRSRFALLSLWLVLAVLGAALLASQFSGRQPLTVALDVGWSAMRLLLPLAGVLLIQELISREFDRRLFLTSLTYPRSRAGFLLGRFCAAVVLVSVLLVIVAALLAAFSGVFSRGYAQSTPVALGLPYLVLTAAALLELWVVLALATLIAVLARTPAFVLIGALGFTFVARSFSTIIAMVERDSTLVSDAGTYSASLGLLSYVLPDLAALDVRMVVLYGRWEFLPQHWEWHILSALAYIGVLVGAAVWALSRKRFE